MDTPQIWFIHERLCMCLQRAQTNRWVCVWQWKENPNLTETQVQGMALARQATFEMEMKHREAVYRDVLNKQQTVIIIVVCLGCFFLNPVYFSFFTQYPHKVVPVVLNLGGIQHLAGSAGI